VLGFARHNLCHNLGGGPVSAAGDNRSRMPRTAATVDAFRRVFGPGVKVRWASEGGLELGERGPPGVPLSETPVKEEDDRAGRRRRA
jgi:hypothetical protein